MSYNQQHLIYSYLLNLEIDEILIMRLIKKWNMMESCVFWVDAWLGGPIWVSCKSILPCGYHCNAHATL